jgi:hypothetical protein
MEANEDVRKSSGRRENKAKQNNRGEKDVRS